MHRRRFSICSGLRHLFVLSASLVAFAAMSAHAECNASFPLEAGKPLGWQGGDAAYSVPLPDGRDVWIFGDTLFGSDRLVEGQTPRMVHNSLGISTCKNGQWHLDYFVKSDAAGKAASYFAPSDPSHWYWALDGFYANGDLWVMLLCIRHPSRSVPAAMDFETCGSDLAQVTHLDQDPQLWHITMHPLVPDGVKAYPSATAVVHDGYVYLFALYESGTRPLLATRISLAKLSNPSANLEFLASDGSWKPGFDPASAKEVMTRGSTELSIRYHRETKKWLAVMVDPAWFSDKVVLSMASDLTGPWSEPRVIYQMPEMQAGSGKNKNIFCYAAKEHPELEIGSDLLFTYVCNSLDAPELMSRKDIYYPKVIRQPSTSLLSH
jgi:hypothetical protein